MGLDVGGGGRGLVAEGGVGLGLDGVGDAIDGGGPGLGADAGGL